MIVITTAFEFPKTALQNLSALLAKFAMLSRNKATPFNLCRPDQELRTAPETCKLCSRHRGVVCAQSWAREELKTCRSGTEPATATSSPVTLGIAAYACNVCAMELGKHRFR